MPRASCRSLLRCGQTAGRQVASAYSQGAGRCRHPDGLAYRSYAAHHCDVRRIRNSRAHGGSRDEILEDALAIEDAGCFMLEFEAVPAKIAKLISEQLTIPTIGIGAGVGTDGQILLCHDLLGVFTDFKPKFTKRFAGITEVAVTGISEYVKEVKAERFRTTIILIPSRMTNTRSLRKWSPSAAKCNAASVLGARLPDETSGAAQSAFVGKTHRHKPQSSGQWNADRTGLPRTGRAHRHAAVEARRVLPDMRS